MIRRLKVPTAACRSEFSDKGNAGASKSNSVLMGLPCAIETLQAVKGAPLAKSPLVLVEEEYYLRQSELNTIRKG